MHRHVRLRCSHVLEQKWNTGLYGGSFSWNVELKVENVGGGQHYLLQNHGNPLVITFRPSKMVQKVIKTKNPDCPIFNGRIPSWIFQVPGWVMGQSERFGQGWTVKCSGTRSRGPRGQLLWSRRLGNPSQDRLLPKCKIDLSWCHSKFGVGVRPSLVLWWANKSNFKG